MSKENDEYFDGGKESRETGGNSGKSVSGQEEGASLFLDAFVTDNLANLVAMIPQNAVLKLGREISSEAGVRNAVKKAAPLVRGCCLRYKIHLSLFGDMKT